MSDSSLLSHPFRYHRPRPPPVSNTRTSQCRSAPPSCPHAPLGRSVQIDLVDGPWASAALSDDEVSVHRQESALLPLLENLGLAHASEEYGHDGSAPPGGMYIDGASSAPAAYAQVHRGIRAVGRGGSAPGAHHEDRSADRSGGAHAHYGGRRNGGNPVDVAAEGAGVPLPAGAGGIPGPEGAGDAPIFHMAAGSNGRSGGDQILGALRFNDLGLDGFDATGGTVTTGDGFGTDGDDDGEEDEEEDDVISTGARLDYGTSEMMPPSLPHDARSYRNS